jgi:hypothetical protein
MAAVSRPTCGLTILSVEGRRLTKTWHGDGSCTAYDQVKRFDLFPVGLAGFDALVHLLQRLERRPDCCLVRAAPRDPARTRNVRRLLHRDVETKEGPTLRDVPRRWCALDLDGLDLPAGTDPRDLAACARAVLPRLPLAFNGARCIVQATASHEIKPGARLRLWFWLDRPTWGGELRRWFGMVHDCPVDVSLFAAVQIHYTAAPIFEGRNDPLPHRLIVLPGRETVRVPHRALLTEPPPPPPRPLRRSANDGGRALAWAEREISRQREGSRHPTALRVAGWLGRLAKEGEVRPRDVTDTIARGLAAAGKDRREGEAIATFVLKKEGLS